MRSRPSPSPLIARDLLMRIDDGMMRELPEAAQDLVLSGRGERTTQLRGAPSADQAPGDLALVSELNAIIERQDWVEGAYVVDNIVATAGIDARSKAADAVRAYWWRSGRWTRARRLLRERDALVSGDEDLRELPPAVALARLEMRAEFEPQKLRGAFCGKPEFTAFAMDLAVQSSDDIGRLGALAFLVVAMSCDASPQRLTRSQEGDPVGAAMSYWNANRSVDDILQTLRDGNVCARVRPDARLAQPDPGPAAGGRGSLPFSIPMRPQC
jgi:hypothetical protein